MAAMTDPRIEDVIGFWRSASTEWFRKSPDFDARFRRAFADLFRAAQTGELAGWEDSAQGCLALLILLDQYPRNAFRGTPQMYATDPQARRIAQLAAVRGDIARVPQDMVLFMVLPFAHSEAPEDQAASVALHRRYLPSGTSRALRHQAIISRFGRFPHRHAILNRELSTAETHYLQSGGFQG
jgi:uncharacterized protein (DUF924 family)